MKKLGCLIFLVFVFCISVFAQNQNNPILLAEIDQNWEDFSEVINHKVADVAYSKFSEDPDGLFAVRVCSSDPLPVAFISTNGGQSLAVYIMSNRLEELRKQWYPETYGIKMFFLRNNNGCKIVKGKPLIEYWFIPKDADFPPFVEIKNAEDIKIKRLIFDFNDFDREAVSSSSIETVTQPSSVKYQCIKNETVKLLKNDKTTYLLIELPAFGSGLKNILPKVTELKSFLTQHKIGSYRIFVKKRIRHREVDAKEELYPNLTVIYQ